MINSYHIFFYNNHYFFFSYTDIVPTTTNNTTITGSSNQNATTTEDNNDDLQPDRDSMVTPKLDESDYKSEHESAETTLAAADQTKQKVTGQPAEIRTQEQPSESSDPSSTDQQQTPSSSDIKAQEEPSSTTSPMPSTPAAPGANPMASPGSTPLPTGPTSSSDSLVAPPELQKAEINSETTKQTENAPKLQAALTSPIPQTDSLKSINQSKDSSDHKKQSEDVEPKSKLDVESALSALKEPLPAGMTGMNF